MERDDITIWRPQKSSEIVGSENCRKTQEIMAEVKHGLWRGPLVFVGAYGTCKTSCCRLLARAVCCSAFQHDGEPCGLCEGCLSQRPDYNGDRHQVRHWEIDCTRISRKRLNKLCSEPVVDDRTLLFLDEVTSLDQVSQSTLLKFVEDYRGILIGASRIDSDRQRLEDVLLPPLCDRLRQVRLHRPTEAEQVHFFADMAKKKDIRAGDSNIRLLVRAAGTSFRKCLRVLSMAERCGEMTTRLIGETLTSVAAGRTTFRNPDILPRYRGHRGHPRPETDQKKHYGVFETTSVAFAPNLF